MLTKVCNKIAILAQIIMLSSLASQTHLQVHSSDAKNSFWKFLYLWFVTMATCKNEETLKTPVNKVNNVLYNWPKRNMRKDGRFPITENKKASQHINRIAVKSNFYMSLLNVKLLLKDWTQYHLLDFMTSAFKSSLANRRRLDGGWN